MLFLVSIHWKRLLPQTLEMVLNVCTEKPRLSYGMKTSCSCSEYLCRCMVLACSYVTGVAGTLLLGQACWALVIAFPTHGTSRFQGCRCCASYLVSRYRLVIKVLIQAVSPYHRFCQPHSYIQPVSHCPWCNWAQSNNWKCNPHRCGAAEYAVNIYYNRDDHIVKHTTNQRCIWRTMSCVHRHRT